VRRSLPDFARLRAQLASSCEGCLLPPLPAAARAGSLAVAAERLLGESADRPAAAAAELQAFLCRLAGHPVLRCAPALALFLEAEAEAWARLAPRGGASLAAFEAAEIDKTLADALQSVSSFFRAPVAAAAEDNPPSPARGSPPATPDGARRRRAAPRLAASLERAEAAVAGFAEAAARLAEAQAASAAALRALAAAARAAAKAEPRGARAMHGGGEGRTALPAPPWPALAAAATELARPLDGAAWAAEAAALPPLREAAAELAAAREAGAAGEALVASLRQAEAAAAAAGSPPRASLGSPPRLAGGGGAAALLRERCAALAGRQAAFASRFERRELPHARRRVAECLRCALVALVAAQASAAGAGGRSAAAFAAAAGAGERRAGAAAAPPPLLPLARQLSGPPGPRGLGPRSESSASLEVRPGSPFGSPPRARAGRQEPLFTPPTLGASLAQAVSALFAPAEEAEAGGGDASPPPQRPEEGTPGLGLYLGTPRGGGGERVPGGMRSLPRTPSGALSRTSSGAPLPRVASASSLSAQGARAGGSPGSPPRGGESEQARALFSQPLPRRRTAPR